MKNQIEDIEDQIAFLRNVTKVQNESITACYAQAKELVNSNALISHDIDSLYTKIRIITKQDK